MVDKWNVGALITELDEQHYANAVENIELLARDPEIKTKTRAVAKELFDLHNVGAQRYAALYEQVLASN